MRLDKNTQELFHRIEKRFEEISLLIKPTRKKKKQKVHVIFLM
jgi:hypothetical protein